MTAHFVAVQTADMSAPGEARRTASRLAEREGLGETEQGKAAIVATELATNLAKHSNGGELCIQAVTRRGQVGLEMTSIDRGPGIHDVERSLQDGYSTSGTLGNGLGSIRRLSHEFDVYSSVPGGTVIYSRVAAGGKSKSANAFQWSGLSRPAPNEEACGDAWRIEETEREIAILVADGLGHGPLAASSANMVASVFHEGPFAPLTAMLQSADTKLRGMRGAAVAVAQVNAAGSVRYAGIGNISGSLKAIGAARGQGLCSHSGTVGVQMRKVQEFEYAAIGDSLVIMHSDGLQSRWDLQTYNGLSHRHPALAAGVLYRDFVRGRDDVTVVVVRISRNDAGHDG